MDEDQRAAGAPGCPVDPDDGLAGARRGDQDAGVVLKQGLCGLLLGGRQCPLERDREQASVRGFSQTPRTHSFAHAGA